jgi:hypothetical protein
MNSPTSLIPCRRGVAALVGTPKNCDPGHVRAIVYAGLDPLTSKQRYLKEVADSFTSD